MGIAPKDHLGNEITDLSAGNPSITITDDDRYADEVWAIIDQLPEQDCQVRFDNGLHTGDLSLPDALELLESAPFSGLEIWNGRVWETVWNGAVEFEGVAPC